MESIARLIRAGSAVPRLPEEITSVFQVWNQHVNSPTAIRQDVAVPSLQDMCSSNLLERLLSWLESQMVRVIKTEIASSLSQLFRC